MTDKMPLANPSFHIVDVWKADVFARPENMLPYRRLMERGLIGHLRVIMSRSSGQAVIDYYSSIPENWTKDALKKEKQEILKGGTGA